MENKLNAWAIKNPKGEIISELIKDTEKLCWDALFYYNDKANEKGFTCVKVEVREVTIPICNNYEANQSRGDGSCFNCGLLEYEHKNEVREVKEEGLEELKSKAIEQANELLRLNNNLGNNNYNPKIRELISKISINKANLEYIAENGKINGSLLYDLEIMINELLTTLNKE